MLVGREDPAAASFRRSLLPHFPAGTGDPQMDGVWCVRLAGSMWQDELSDGFLTDFRQTVREKNPDSVVIGEVWEDATDKVSYDVRKQYFRGRELDGVMNYPLREAIIGYLRDKNADRFRETTERLYRRYPKWASDCQMNFLGTHDTIRILTALG